MPALPALKRSTQDPPPYPRLSKPVALVVDESTRVRTTTARMLEGFGFLVYAASTAAEARVHVEGLHEPVDLLVVDIVLPDGPGDGLARELRERDPGLPILFVSEDGEVEFLEGGFDDLEAPFLGSRYDPPRLAEKIRTLLRV